MTVPAWHGEPYTRADVLFGFLELVRSRGGDPAALAVRAGIDPRALTDPTILISFLRYGALLERASAVLDIPDLGLELGSSAPEHLPNMAPVVFLARTRNTFGDWMAQALKFWRYHTNGYEPRLVPGPTEDCVTLRFVPSPGMPVPRQQFELLLAGACQIGRLVTGRPEIAPLIARFRHGAPADIDTHRRVFRCALEFGADHNELVLGRELLSLPIHDGDLPPSAIFERILRYRIKNMPEYNQSLRTTARIAIETALGSGMCSRDFIAELMGISPGRLRRLLAEEGTSFADLLDATRRTAAQAMLARTDVPIAAIAGLLDYNSTTALSLAMKRWCDMTPSQYRERNGEPLPPAP